jgi:flavodoxin
MEAKMKKLVVYYSFEGNTRLVAQAIARAVDADLLELRPIHPVRTKGFGKYVWGGAQVVMGRAPELAPWPLKPSDYDVIYIGTPVWAFSMAPPLRTFFRQAELLGKAVALFCTHEGGRGRTWEHMRRALAGNDVLGETEFLMPLREPEAASAAAQSWAREMLGKLRG